MNCYLGGRASLAQTIPRNKARQRSGMKTNKWHSAIVVTAVVAIAIVFPDRLPAQSAAVKQVSAQVHSIDPGEVELAYSFQVAIYENLLQELNKTKEFRQVFREGDRSADQVSNLLILKTTVEKYTPGDETRRAV